MVAVSVCQQDVGRSLYGGSMLSQIGEFSFVLAAIGLATQLISIEGYRLVVGTIALSLVLSPPWLALLRRLTNYRGSAAQEEHAA